MPRARQTIQGPQPGDVFDPTRTLERINHDMRLFEELVGMFLEDVPALVGEIRKSVDHKDTEALKRSAHLLRGAIGNFSVAEAYETAKTLESMGRAGDMTGALVVVDKLETETDRLATALNRYLSKPA